MPGNCPYRFQNSVLSWFPGRDETGNTVSSRLVLRFWINWKSRLVSNLDFRRLKSLVLSWKAFCCLDLSWIYLSCLDVSACLVSKKFQDFVPVSSCLVSRFSCPDPSLSLARPKIKVDQIWKIRPFFQSAHQADFKNAKIFEKSSFFEKICLRKPARVHWPSHFFCSKSCIWLMYDWAQVLKKSFDSFQKLKIWHPEFESAVASHTERPRTTFLGFWLSIT